MSKRSLLDRSISSEAASHTPTVAAAAAAAVAAAAVPVPTAPTAPAVPRRSRHGPTPENPYSKLNPPMEDQLFVPSRTKNKGNYVCIRLIGSVEAMESGKPLTSDDAVGAWCTVCKESVWWKKGESNGISRHMSRIHSDILREAGIELARSKSLTPSSGKRKRGSEIAVKAEPGAFHPTSSLATNQKCSPLHQAKFDAMTLVWLTNHFRTYDLVQDEGLKEMIAFASQMPGEPQLCSNRQLMEQYSSVLQKACNVRLGQWIQTELVTPQAPYALSQDQHAFWSGKDNNHDERIVLSVTSVHYVSEDFTPKTLCLRSSASAHHRDSDRLLDFDAWGLEESKVAFLSNVGGDKDLSAPKDTSAEAEEQDSTSATKIPVVGRCLQDICGIFYSEPKQAHVKPKDDIADFVMDDRSLAAMEEEEHVKTIRTIVSKIRDICQSSVQKKGSNGEGLDLTPDISSRWNSTHSMLKSAIGMQSEVDRWVESLASAMEEDGSPKAPPAMSPKDWSLARGIWILMTPFQNLTESLGFETDPVPLAYTIPFLRRVKQILHAKNLFGNDESGAEERMKCGRVFKAQLEEFLADHENISDFEAVVQVLETCQSTMRKEFEYRFKEVDNTFLWASMLDPRLRKLNHGHNDQEREQAKAALIEEMITLTRETRATDSEQETERKPPPSSSDDMFGDVFDYPGTNSSGNGTSKTEDADQRTSWDQQTAEYELAQYLSAPSVHKSVSAFRWWCANYTSYPMLARCARKWLAPLAMITPDDRILSGTGLILSATAPGGFCNEEQWDLRMKLKSLSLSTEEIVASLKEEPETANTNAIAVKRESLVPAASSWNVPAAEVTGV